MLAFYVFAAVYAAIVQPDAEQTVTEDLGADEGARADRRRHHGHLRRAGRRRSSSSAASSTGRCARATRRWSRPADRRRAVRLIHCDCSAEALLILPPLALLGFIFCLVYERTGSLYPVIALHAFNNTIAFGVQADDGWRSRPCSGR